MNAHERLIAGGKLTREGRHEEALSHFLWFHDHSLAEDPAYRGVRLSFALAYWLELAKQYPPALAAFRIKIDEKLVRLANGELDRNLFNDIEAMNEHLGEDEKTADLFASLDKQHPEFAQRCSGIAVPALVRTKRFSLAAKYISNPEAQILARAKELMTDVKEIDARPRTRTPIYQAYVNIFAERLQQIETVLKATGQEDSATQLRATTMEFLKPAYLRNAILKQLTSDS